MFNPMKLTARATVLPIATDVPRRLEVLLIDDHPLYREALATVLANLQRTLVLHEAGSVVEAFSVLDRRPRLDLIVLDLGLPGGGGLPALLALRQLATATPIAVVSANDTRALVTAALGMGAQGYIPKSADYEEMQSALTCILAGEVYVPMHGHCGAHDGLLSKRQKEILVWIAAGKSNKEVAALLGLAATTVRDHVTELFKKLEVRSRTAAIAKARTLQLLD